MAKERPVGPVPRDPLEQAAREESQDFPEKPAREAVGAHQARPDPPEQVERGYDIDNLVI